MAIAEIRMPIRFMETAKLVMKLKVRGWDEKS
jgi:hypothetical protein